MRPEKQARRMLKLARVVEKREGQFDMATWMRDGTEGRKFYGADDLREIAWVANDQEVVEEDALQFLAKHEAGQAVTCGMTACLGGWAVLTFPQEAVEVAKEIGNTEIYDVASVLLGLDTDSGIMLVNGDEYENPQGRSLFNGSAPWQTGEEAARELRRRAAVILTEAYG